MTTESNPEDRNIPQLELDVNCLTVEDAPSGNWQFSSVRSGWLLLALLLLIETVSFHRMVVRDIEGIYPFSFDQGLYLTQAYDAFETIRDQGVWAGLQKGWFSGTRTTGTLVQGEAAVLYMFLGASRTTSLLLLFAHFALLQVALWAAFRHLTKTNSLGFIAVALVLFSTSRFFYAGGLNDFRFDNPASCLYGITLCAFICSDQFTNKLWTSFFVLSVTALVTTRFVSISYVAIAIIISLGLYAILTYRSERRLVAVWRQSRMGLLACGIAALLSAPFIVPNIPALMQYYVVGHITSSEKSIRAVEHGVTDRISAILFYPRSLAWDHLGSLFLVVCIMLLVLALASRTRELKVRTAASNLRRQRLSLSLVIAIIWIAIPMALFTLDESKSPVVAGVMVVPAVISFCFLYLLLAGGSPSGSVGSRFKRGEEWVAVLLLAVACMYSVSFNSRRNPQLQMAKDAGELYIAVDDLAAGIQRNGLKQAKVATDALLDYFSQTALQVMIYERTGRMVDIQELLATTIMNISKTSAMKAMEESDYALVTLSGPALDRSVLPFQHSMVEYRQDLLSYARDQMIPMHRVQVADHNFQVYERPRIGLFGNSGDWIPNTGVTLRVGVPALQKFGYILLTGPTMHSRELKEGLRCNAFLVASDKRQIPLKTVTHLGVEEYAIGIDARPATSVGEGLVDIVLEFPTYFVPVERGINPDTRKLVVSAPRSLRLVPGVSSYPPSLAAIAAKP